MTEKIKKVSKYVMNSLAVANALLVGLNPIWNIPYAGKIIATITVITGVISTYLLSDKAVRKMKGDE